MRKWTPEEGEQAIERSGSTERLVGGLSQRADKRSSEAVNGTSQERCELAYIVDTFPVVLRRDEDEYGEYGTERVVLAASEGVESLRH